MDDSSQERNRAQAEQIRNNADRGNYQGNAQARNDANNANIARNAAAVASQSGHPIAAGIGKGVQVADRLTGGKASEKIGKAATKALKHQGLKGKALQHAMNKMSESGTSDRIGKAMSASSGRKGLSQGGKTDGSLKSRGKINGMGSSSGSQTEKKQEIRDQATDGGGSFRVTFKAIKYTLIVLSCVFPFVVFIVLLVSASQVVANSIGLGNADSVSASDAEKKITEKMEKKPDELNNEVNDEAIVFDKYIDDYYLYESSNNLVLVAKDSSVYADLLDELDDFYSGINNYTEQYDKDDVYMFFLKLYDIRNYYVNNYGVNLDMALLFATLNQQSDDKALVFSSNIVNYDRNNQDYFSYDYDWSNYNTNRYDSSHDIEVLAQHMISMQSIETCVNSSGQETQKNILRDGASGGKTLVCAEGEKYMSTQPKYSLDEEKYREYLKEFLEKKYYINDDSYPGVSCPDGSTDTPFTTYDLTSEQLLLLSAVAAREQGSPKGASAEASLMANLFEIKGSKFGVGGSGLYNYVVNSGWFGNKVLEVDRKKATPEIIEAVRSVLVYGRRTLPGYVNEHDCIVCYKDGSGDIESVVNNGSSVDVKDRSNYIQHVSKIKNIYGATYTFYSFPTDVSDPFGYTSEDLRKQIGDFHYDYDTGQASECNVDSNGPTSTGMSSAFVNLAVAQLNDPSKNGGRKYWQFMGWNSRVPWCAAFVSWNIYNTTYNGQKLSDIIRFKNSAVYAFMNEFYKRSDLNFYYNDNCSKFRGKNKISGTYTPKEGDLIFFDWDGDWKGVMPTSFGAGADHIGIVQGVENGKIKTIEGNAGDATKERFFNLDSCQVIGFGSWY